jgi:type I restriction enzyme S subunit
MPSSDRRATTLGQLIDEECATLQTGPFGSQLHASDYVPSGIAVIPTEAIGRRTIRDIILPQVSAETAARLSRHSLQPGDILFARRGVQATGLSAIVGERHRGSLCGTGAIRLRLSCSDVDPTYVSFWLSASRSIEWIKAHAVGGVMPNVNESVLRLLPLQFPPIDVQREIVTLLSSLDDKVALNSDINTRLETLAGGLFRSWFVDFEPSAALRDRRQALGVPPEAIDLFPDHFEESEIGAIPRGWRIRSLNELVRPQIGGVWGEDAQSPDASVIAISLRGIDCHDLAECIIPEVEPRWFSERQLRDRTLKGGEILIEGSGSRCGRSLLVDKATLGLFGKAVTYSNFCKRFDTTESSALAVLSWFALRDEYRSGSLDAYRIGSAFPNFDADGAFRNTKLAVPDNDLPTIFEGLWNTIRNQQVASMSESRTLAHVRDTLLGPLLSGELAIKAAEKAIGAVI